MIKVFVIITASTLLAFTIRNIHALSNVTEGGVLGLSLLFKEWFNLSPAITSFILGILCYFIGYKILGKKFIFYSLIGVLSYSVSYGIFEQFPPIYSGIANHPLLAAILGGLLVGITAGICVKLDSAPTSDDALAITISSVTNIKIEYIYFIFDVVVLLLSLTYIPVTRILYSFLTVLISGQTLGIIQKIKFKNKKLNETLEIIYKDEKPKEKALELEKESI